MTNRRIKFCGTAITVLHVDDSIPPDQIRFVNPKTDEVVGLIYNIGRLTMIRWTFHNGDGQSWEWWDSEAGHVDYTPSGWDAFLELPGQDEHKIGECYKTAASAKAAVVRAYRKHQPLNP